MSRSSQEQVIVHAAGERWGWALLDRQGATAKRGHTDPGSARWPGDRPVTVLVDAGLCMGLKVELPDLPSGKLAQALRWAAEEHLAGSAEQEHVVAGPRDSAGRLCCVVINESVMRELHLQFAGNPAETMVPDALCLPWQAGQVSLAESGGRILVRWDQWSFGSFEADQAEAMLEGMANEQVGWVWYGGDRPAWLEPRDVRNATTGKDLLEVLAPGAKLAAVNLLSGPWSPRSAVAARTHWRWAAGLAAAVVAITIASAAIERHLLIRQAESLQAQIESRFEQTFPDVGRLVRPREQAERELARLRFGQAAGLLDLMNRIAPVVEGQNRLVLDGLNYRDGVLELTLRAPDVAALDQLEQRLRALDLTADVQSASLDADGASGRIRISEARR